MNWIEIKKSQRIFYSLFGKWIWAVVFVDTLSAAGMIWSGGIPRVIFLAIIIFSFLVGPMIVFHKYRLSTDQKLAARDKIIADLETTIASWKDTGAKKARLADIMWEGRRILNRPVCSQKVDSQGIADQIRGMADFDVWVSDYEAWMKNTFDYIRDVFGDAEVAAFMHSNIMAAHMKGSVNELHNISRLKLSAYISNVVDLSKRLGN